MAISLDIDTLPGGVLCGYLLCQTAYNLKNGHFPFMIKFFCNGTEELADLQNAVTEYNEIPNRRAIEDSQIYMLLGLNPDAYFDEYNFQIKSSIPKEICHVHGDISYLANDTDVRRYGEYYSWPWSATPLNGIDSPSAFEHARKFLPFLPYTRMHHFGPGNTVEGSIEIENASVDSFKV